MSAVAARRAYVGLGSNLGDSRRAVSSALSALAALSVDGAVRCSSLYETPPWGVLEQPSFINAAASFDTSLAPLDLLQALLAIERAAGRVRNGTRWGPRTLDLDLLHMQNVVFNDERLVLPHPRIVERAFVLLPLCELEPELDLPAVGRVAELLERVACSGCVKLA